jgi:hypothetical protein
VECQTGKRARDARAAGVAVPEQPQGEPGGLLPPRAWWLKRRRMFDWFDRDDCPVTADTVAVFRAMFDKADGVTLECAPSIPYLMARSRHKRTATKRVVRALVAAGAVRVIHQGGHGPGDATVYRLLIP